MLYLTLTLPIITSPQKQTINHVHSIKYLSTIIYPVHITDITRFGLAMPFVTLVFTLVVGISYYVKAVVAICSVTKQLVQQLS